MNERDEADRPRNPGVLAGRSGPDSSGGSSGPDGSGLDGSGLDARAELSEFLRSRRARLKPEDVGLPQLGQRRRVPGLRREELAQLAGVSVAYYTRLEQGNGQGVSTEVLDAISRALRLTDAEHAHLTHLAQPKAKKRRRTCDRTQQLRPAVQQLLDSMDSVPAYAVGRRTDILGYNSLAATLFGWGDLPPRERNWARLVFLHPASRELFQDWDAKAADIVSYLRMDAGCHADDPQLSALVGELSVKSEEFRRLWAAHDVKEKGFGTKQLRHPVVGELLLSFESFKLAGEEEISVVTYHAEPGSPASDALRMLASWAADAPSASSTRPAP